MRYLRARLDQPEWMRHPMQEFLASSDAMEREELLAWNLSRDDVQFALFFAVGDVDAYRDRVDEVAAIRRYELTPVDEESFYVYVCQEYTESDVAFFGAFAELNLVVVPPLVYDGDGRGKVTVVGPSEALTELVVALRERAGIGVDVLEIGRYDRRQGTAVGELTDRQYEAVETATRLGYYDVPRSVSLVEVADELGVAAATASELLRRAESNLMGRLFGARRDASR
jgi:predicted DNA binding protein